MNSQHNSNSRAAKRLTIRTIARFTFFILVVGIGVGAAIAAFLARSSTRPQRTNLIKTVEERLHHGREVVNPALERLEKEFTEMRTNVGNHVTYLK
jgi:MFS superfamily sulfate permease-like transporter